MITLQALNAFKAKLQPEVIKSANDGVRVDMETYEEGGWLMVRLESSDIIASEVFTLIRTAWAEAVVEVHGEDHYGYGGLDDPRAIDIES